MEDTHFLMPHMCGEKDIHVFGIFDGHRVETSFLLLIFGDCGAMLSYAFGDAYALSKDHVASCPEEKRIIGEGGQVKWQVDTWRVGLFALRVFFLSFA
ncbi:Protein kinase and PP2C-like domain-containing protein [Camellia lanceoleosa]|uniref:Protein kinase and PP2C-like domain-containing protein n=1 Tax=Camellia lanceoleosa TaxID=1840588 RepID=A0ACC0FSL3_9ERIC|nr:Protein kinase and PP2C-like domain-containing protein [Camellia lanceoleosa]